MSWVRYFIRFFRLLIKAGAVWGVYVDPSLPLRDQGEDLLWRICDTPLQFEAERLLRERDRLRGVR